MSSWLAFDVADSSRYELCQLVRVIFQWVEPSFWGLNEVVYPTKNGPKGPPQREFDSHFKLWNVHSSSSNSGNSTSCMYAGDFPNSRCTWNILKSRRGIRTVAKFTCLCDKNEILLLNLHLLNYRNFGHTEPTKFKNSKYTVGDL